MRDRIEVDKTLIPYSFDILLAAEWFNLEFHYNKTADLFTVTLSKNGEVLIYNEPIVYGMPLFADAYQSGLFPMLDIVPWDESGNADKVTYENFGETVFLTIDNVGDET
jgi:hypothetical protein